MTALRVAAVALVASLAVASSPFPSSSSSSPFSVAKSGLANVARNAKRLYDPRTRTVVADKGMGDDEALCVTEWYEAVLMCDQAELMDFFHTLDCGGFGPSACGSPCYGAVMAGLSRLDQVPADCSFLTSPYCESSDMCDQGDQCVYGECRTPCASDQDCAIGCANGEPESCCSFWDENGVEQMMCCENGEGPPEPEDPLVSLREPNWPGAFRQVFDVMCHTNADGQDCVEAISTASVLNTCEAYQAAGCCLSSLLHCAGDMFDEFRVDQECDVDLSEPCQECYGGPACMPMEEEINPCQMLKAAGFCWKKTEFQPYMLAFCPYQCGACDNNDQCMFDKDEAISALAASLGVTVSSCDEAVVVAANMFGTPYCSGPYASVLNSHCPCACTRANNWPQP